MYIHWFWTLLAINAVLAAIAAKAVRVARMLPADGVVPEPSDAGSGSPGPEPRDPGGRPDRPRRDPRESGSLAGGLLGR